MCVEVFRYWKIVERRLIQEHGYANKLSVEYTIQKGWWVWIQHRTKGIEVSIDGV